MSNLAIKDLTSIYLRNFTGLIRKGLKADEDNLRAFYFLIKYFRINNEPSEQDFQLSMIDELLLTGVSTKKFMMYFPIIKEYDGEKYQMKDYYSTIEAVRQHGSVINNVFDFLWDYHNMDIKMYLVKKMSLVSNFHQQQTGTSIIEEFFDIKPMYLKNIDGKEVLYNPETGKTKPLKRHKRKPKWIKLVK